MEYGKTWCSAERKHVITEQQWNQSILHRRPLTQEYQNLFARLFTVPLFIPKERMDRQQEACALPACSEIGSMSWSLSVVQSFA